MKIIIYALNFKPDLIGVGKYTGELADYLYENNCATILSLLEI